MSAATLGGGIGAAALYVAVSNPTQIGARPEGAEGMEHHLKKGKGFVNPWESFRDKNPFQMGAAMLWLKLSGALNTPVVTPPTVPIQKPTFLPTRSTPKLRATWLGHACYYIEFPSGLRVLFDPVFEDCCAPVNLKSLKRYTPPPCEIEDLPFIDVVVISHNHYDHLSFPSTQRIIKKFPNAHFFAPLGNKKWFNESGVQNVTDLDWWEERAVTLTESNGNGKEMEQVSIFTTAEDASSNGNIAATISALPCQHVSARTPFDKCQTLWASWSVESGGAKVFFAGDTGYRSVPRLSPDIDDYSEAYSHLPHCPAFEQIGKYRGPFDLGLIPIGAYAPRFIMSQMHANPKDAVNIFVDTQCRKALGMHWGTWVLTEEDWDEPAVLLREALAWKGILKGPADKENKVPLKKRERTAEAYKKGLEGEDFDVVDIGESRDFESGAKA